MRLDTRLLARGRRTLVLHPYFLAAAESVGVRLTVWFQVSGERQLLRPLIEAASTDTADLRLLWTVARTLRFTPSGR